MRNTNDIRYVLVMQIQWVNDSLTIKLWVIARNEKTKGDGMGGNGTTDEGRIPRKKIIP